MNKCFKVGGQSNIHEITTRPQRFTVQGQAQRNLYIIGSKQPHN
jgi:hypothetical protein